MSSLTDGAQWKALKSKYLQLANVHMRDLFACEKMRGERFSIQAVGLYLDYSKNRIDEEAVDLLCELANARYLSEKITLLFNTPRHPALRHLNNQPDNNDFIREVQSSWKKIKIVSDQLRDGSYKGFTGKSITDVVNIGVGGSCLGSKMTCFALKPYAHTALRCHFISNLDEADADETLRCLNPETTLFIIASKSLTTKETLENMHRAKEWLLRATQAEKLIRPHFMAVTASPEKIRELGISPENIFIFWPWVGGRFSVWSVVGLCIVTMIGWERFYEFLSGAHEMDIHFQKTEFKKNMPVLLALLSIWYTNFFNIETQAIIPYSYRLRYLPDYLKQLHMESQGKSIQCDGNPVDYKTGAVIWGGVGTDSQHSFHQLFMQGTVTAPVDFVAVLKNHQATECQLPLIANCLGQSETLMQGYPLEAVTATLIAQGVNPKEAYRMAKERTIAGNNPSNTIILDQLTPYSLGALLALYEHKVYVQNVIWNINAFDQWGVERGKYLTDDVLGSLRGNGLSSSSFGSSTEKLINYTICRNKTVETIS